ENVGGFFRRDCPCVALQPCALQTYAGPFVRVELDACDSPRIASRACRNPRRFSRIHYQAQHRRKRFGQSAPGNWWSARPPGQPAFHRTAVVFLHATGASRALSNLFHTKDTKTTRDTKIRKALKRTLPVVCRCDRCV